MELARLIERSCALRELTLEAEAFRRTAAATALPSRPGVHAQITAILADPGWEPDQIALTIESDIAITAKVLQLANSAFFGIGRTVTSVREAVVYLGVETIKSLTLMAEAFGKLAPEDLEGFSIEQFQRHAMLVARVAGAILPPGRSQQEAVTAGLLHDIGKLVLIADDPQQWNELNDLAVERHIPLHEVEEEVQGVTHAATGAYLLSSGASRTASSKPSPTITTPASSQRRRWTRSLRCTSPTRWPTTSRPGRAGALRRAVSTRTSWSS